jgi:predicted nucleic acid-binding protein
MVIGCDTGFLCSMYGSDAHSPKAVAWARKSKSPVHLNAFAHFEFGNALRFSEFRQALKPGEAAGHWARFEAAIHQGRLVLHANNLMDVVDEARRISAARTLAGGHRAFDILHVATAIRLGAKEFLTFDANQKRLADNEGLHVPV